MFHCKKNKLLNTLLILLFLFFIPSDQPNNMEAQTLPVIRREATEIPVQIIPLENRSGDPSVDYLGVGLIKMLAVKLERIAYVADESDNVVFLARIRKEDQTEISNNKQNKEYTRKKLRLIFDPDKKTNIDQKAAHCRKNGLRYLVYGSYTLTDTARTEVIRNDEVTVTMNMYDAKSGKEDEYIYKSRLEKIYQVTESEVQPILQRIIGMKLVEVQVNSQPEGAMVFFDDHFLGKTPVKAQVLPSDYKAELTADGFESRSFEIKQKELLTNPIPEFNIQLARSKNSARLVANSEPEDADVYLNMQYLGKTPLVSTHLPSGKHRLRFSKDGFIDRFAGIELASGEQTEVNLKLREGDTLKLYKESDAVILDWDYMDLSFASALTSLGFYGVYWHYETKYRQKMDELVPLTGGIMVFTEYEPFYYYWYRMQRNERARRYYKENYELAAGMGLATLMLSGYFMYEYLDYTSEKRNPGEIEFTPAIGFSTSPSGDFAKSQVYHSENQYYLGLFMRF